MSRKGLLCLIIILIISIFSGCTTAVEDVNQAKNNIETDAYITQYPLTIKDYSGADVEIPAEPQRIITFFPSNTEILYALGLEDRVIALTSNDNYPVNVQEKVEYVFGDGVNPNIEQVINLNSDLIVLGAHSDELLNSLKRLNIPVVKYNPQSLDEVYQTIKDIGIITNKQSEAETIVTDMMEKEEMISSEIGKLQEKDKKRVWVEVAPGLWTCGYDTFMNQLIEKAGGINIVDKSGWIQYSEENIIEKNPETIITTYGYYDPNSVDNILNRAGWQNIEAVKNKQVYEIDSDLVNRPGPRIIDAIEEIAKTIYPGLFN